MKLSRKLNEDVYMTIKIILAVSVASLPVSIKAGEATGVVKSVIVEQNGLISFELDNTGSGRPSCANGMQRWSLFDNSPNSIKSEAIKRMYALLLASQTAKIKIHIAGSNLCNNGSYQAEDVGYIYSAP